MKVSVIIPVYNAEKYIERCVASLLGQTYDDIELIFVDDASTDASLSLLEAAIAGHEGKCIVVRNSTNQGCAETRRVGMKLATGDYMIHVDSDDYVSPHFISKLAGAAAAEDADVVVCDFNYDYRTHVEHRRMVSCDSPVACLADILSGVMHGSLCNKLVRSSILRDNDIYPTPGITLGEDKFILVRALVHATRIARVDEPLYYYNKTNTMSVTSQRKADVIPSLIELTRQIDAYFDGRDLPPVISRGIAYHKSLVMGHMLLYGDIEGVDEHKSMFSSVTTSSILTHPVAPLHYKAIGIAYHAGMRFLALVIARLYRILYRIK